MYSKPSCLGVLGSIPKRWTAPKRRRSRDSQPDAFGGEVKGRPERERGRDERSLGVGELKK